MKRLFIEQSITYDGSQLRPGWFADRYGVQGDVIAAFYGPGTVRIGTEKPFVSSQPMLHFLIEHAQVNPRELMLMQRTLMMQMLAYLGKGFTRKQNTLFVLDMPVGYSEIHYTPIASLIHVCYFLEPQFDQGLAGLTFMNINHRDFLFKLFEDYGQSMQTLPAIVSGPHTFSGFSTKALPWPNR
ncbi:MAG: DUF366 family protein [Candidatus Margulisiibacteriota bacterium]